RRPGVRLELKGRVAALHYRAAPEAEAECLAAAEAARAAGEGLAVQAGKMVVEVKPVGADKGGALRRTMRDPPFAGRRPVVAGDDATDEDAIAAAVALGGVGIKVGPGETGAAIRAESPEAFRRWLLDQLEG
ncbi:MAG: trehalose-phosphatase, partial [Paracoccaceae bacterium]